MRGKSTAVSGCTLLVALCIYDLCANRLEVRLAGAAGLTPELGPTELPELGPTELPELGPTELPELGPTEARALGSMEPPELLLFAGIHTAPKAWAERSSVRGSWMRDLRQSSGHSVELRFVIGVRKLKSGVLKWVKGEAAEHKDILLLPVRDHPNHKAWKTLAFLRWCAEKGPRASFIMKLDDDVFVHHWSLLPFLQQRLAVGGNAVMGVFHECGGERPGKYGYPAYPEGGGYILTAAIAKALGGAHLERNRRLLLANESPALGVWVDALNKTEPSRAVEFVRIPATTDGCNPSDFLSMGLHPLKLPCISRRARKNSSNVCCGATESKQNHTAHVC